MLMSGVNGAMETNVFLPSVNTNVKVRVNERAIADSRCEYTLRNVSLPLRVQNAVSAQPCVGKFRISLVLLNFLHCNFRLWFETT